MVVDYRTQKKRVKVRQCANVRVQVAAYKGQKSRKRESKANKGNKRKTT